MCKRYTEIYKRSAKGIQRYTRGLLSNIYVLKHTKGTHTFIKEKYRDTYTTGVSVHTQEVYKKYTRSIQEVYKKYTRSIQEVYKKYTRSVQEVYKRCTRVYKRFTRGVQEMYRAVYRMICECVHRY